MIAIRNTVHIHHGKFIGDLIVGVREDASTLGKPIPIGNLKFLLNKMVYYRKLLYNFRKKL